MDQKDTLAFLLPISRSRWFDCVSGAHISAIVGRRRPWPGGGVPLWMLWLHLSMRILCTTCSESDRNPSWLYGRPLRLPIAEARVHGMLLPAGLNYRRRRRLLAVPASDASVAYNMQSQVVPCLSTLVCDPRREKTSPTSQSQLVIWPILLRSSALFLGLPEFETCMGKHRTSP